MRICLIGNSHVACIMTACLQDDQGLAIDFFATPGNTAREVLNQGNVLVPTSEKVEAFFRRTSGGQGEIDLAGYDAIVMHGLMPGPIAYLALRPSLRTEIYYSSQVLAAASPFPASVCAHLAREVRATSSIPIYSSHAPYPAVVEHKSHQSEAQYRQLEALMSTQLQQAGVRPLLQPDDTVVGLRYTRLEFTKGSAGLTGAAHGEEDVQHMNPLFGARYLANLKQVLAPP